jgi:threonylcarbamoyladenosine tRNA methylthiotransferase MtaB
MDSAIPMRDTTSAPRVALRTVGCRLNQAESAQMAAAFQAAGYVVVAADEPCDVFVVHSCTITGNAESDSARLARSASRRDPRPVVVLAGCAVEVGGDEIGQRSHADLVVGQAEKFELPDLLAAGFGLPPPAPQQTSSALPLFTSTRAIVRVQDGCRFGCSYCIVPQARSRLWSRPLAEVVEEVQRLGEAGFREIVVTGANLGCYRDDTQGLTDLLAALLANTSTPRIRLSSIEASTISPPLLELMTSDERICRALHIPLQSGSDAVLERMRRRYTRASFQTLVNEALATMPLLGIGTDIITGFPGETDDDFARTRELVEALPFGNLHVFPFSPRPGTGAATLDGAVDTAVARDRAKELIALGEAKRTAFAQQFIGREVSVLVEKTDDAGGTGWTSEYLPARVSGGVVEHQIVTVTPTAWTENYLVQ